MYLSRLILNLRHRAVQRDLADCQALHRTVMAAFPAVTDEPARAALGVLYRVDADPRTGRTVLLVQSSVQPDWGRLPAGYLLDTGGDPENPACKSVAAQYSALCEGMVLLFRLRANPTRKIETRSGPDGQRRNGRRVELRTEDQQLAWLARKGEQHGFALLAVRVAGDGSEGRVIPNVRSVQAGKLTGSTRRAVALAPGESALQSRAARLTIVTVQFEGLLRITDVARFQQALRAGIGPGKAYGCGLLSIAPAPGNHLRL